KPSTARKLARTENPSINPTMPSAMKIPPIPPATKLIQLPRGSGIVVLLVGHRDATFPDDLERDSLRQLEQEEIRGRDHDQVDDEKARGAPHQGKDPDRE